MRKIWSSLKTSCTASFNRRADARSVPNGFSMITRARSLSPASGEHLRPRDPTAAEQLTPQELQIALLVSEGLTNRDVGARLFLSPKTVEFHLTRIFRKLQIHSRAELVRRRIAETHVEPTEKV